MSELRIAEIPAGPNGGSLGITFAPGKQQDGAMSGTHRRDLIKDLDVVQQWGACAVVCLVTSDELTALKIPTLGEEVCSRFMEFHHLPIEDYHAPDEAFEVHWPDRSRRLRGLITAGNKILVHCKGGLGRAGTVAARLLVEMGQAPDEAIAAVRAARSPLAIETPDQEAWVHKGLIVEERADLSTTARQDRALGALLGLAVGDAVGTTIEFAPKPDKPVLFDLVGGGPFRLEPGGWTDDTSMALALADSLIEHPEFNPADLMSRFLSWYNDGAYSHNGRCFDIGNTTLDALEAFEETGAHYAGSTHPESAGNGSIMRLAPVAIRYWNDRSRAIRVARDQSRTTHATAEVLDSCVTLSVILSDLISGRPLAEVLAGAANGGVKGFQLSQSRNEVRGSGYVVASLHAALWAVSRTSNFENAVLMAANLGEDADTTAAIAGQIAGAAYGMSAIPGEWLNRLAWRSAIQSRAETLFYASLQNQLE